MKRLFCLFFILISHSAYAVDMDLAEALAVVEVAHRAGGNCKLKVDSYGVEDIRSKDCILYFFYAKSRINDAIKILESDTRMPRADIQESLKNAHQVIAFDEYIQAAEAAYREEQKSNNGANFVWNKNTAIDSIDMAYKKGDMCMSHFDFMTINDKYARECVNDFFEITEYLVIPAVAYLETIDLPKNTTDHLLEQLTQIDKNAEYFKLLLNHP